MTRRLPLLESTASRAGGVALGPELATNEARRPPAYAVWELTLRCDLACKHCGSRAGRARPDELSLDEALRLVAELSDLGILEVTLIGGEAYLYPGWLEVVAAIVGRGMVCTMTSGGRGIDQALAEQAAAAGLHSVSLSVDGLGDTHDALRASHGAYAQVLRAYQALRSAGLSVAMNSHVNRQNQHQLEQLFDLAVEQGCHGWQVFLTVPMGRAADTPDLILQPHDLLTLMPRITALHQKGQAVGLRILPGNNIGYFGPSERRLRGQLRPAAASSCGAGRSVIGIEANGDIKGCPSLFTRDWVGGNVREYPLRAIWERSDRLRYFSQRTVDDLWGYCRTCYYAEQCKAGCSWTASAFLGRPGNNPYCHHRVLDFEARGLKETMTRVQPPPGESFDRGLWSIEVEAIE